MTSADGLERTTVPGTTQTCFACLFDCAAGTNYCPNCGQNLHAPLAEGWVVRGVDLRHVARWQRRLVWYFLAGLLFTCLPYGASPILGKLTSAVYDSPLGWLFWIATNLGVNLIILIGVVGLLAALRTSMWVRVIYIILMIAPCANLIMLLIANAQATGALRAAGLRVGFMGAKDVDVVRLLSRYSCHQCGYSLVGNTSGRCPECGTPSHFASPASPSSP